LVLLVCFASGVLAQSSPRRPRGIYAVVDVADQITKWTQQYPEITEAQLASGFATPYSDLLLNPAISGLAIQIDWDTLEPDDPRNYDNPYDWSYLQPAFDAIQQNSADPSCGWATFKGYSEPTDNNNNKLPLPWNATYISEWQTFLGASYAQYGTNPALVSIAVAGPAAASVEMILPSNTTATPIQPQNGLSPNAMWGMLFTFQLGITPPERARPTTIAHSLHNGQMRSARSPSFSKAG
jgi:hypothetical protein